MELAWIEDFIALSDTQNFTAAANMRHSTQPAFSRRIQNLENWLGVTLFNRNSRPVSLTAAGSEFVKRAHRLREDILDARRIVNMTATNLPDAVIIYTTNTIAVGLLPQWISDNKINAYRLVVSSVQACLEAVRQNRCDYAIIPSFPNNKEVIPQTAIKISSDRLVFATAKTSKFDFNNGYIKGAVLMYSPKTAFGIAIDNKMKQNNVYLSDKPVCESASAEALLAQVRCGMGGGWIIESLLMPHDEIQLHTQLFDIPFDIMLINSVS